jgi:predicted metal-dependent hydrolase
MKQAIFKFRYGNEIITYSRINSPRHQKKVLIQVFPHAEVVVKADALLSDEEVKTAVKKRTRWIYQKLQACRLKLSTISPRHYISGESHLYLGKRYQLKVMTASKEIVKLLRGKIEIAVTKKEPEKIKQLLQQWYREKALTVFERRLEILLPKALWISKKPSLRLLKMRKQWGSCSASGSIILNPLLIKASTECIDYVILHELCHIAEHNHSRKFYALMKQVIPHWQETRNILDGLTNILLNDVITK